MSDEHILELIESLLETRQVFLARTINQIPHPARSNAFSRYMMNEMFLIELMARIQRAERQQNNTTLNGAVVTLNIPTNFLDPVTVTPTQQQI